MSSHGALATSLAERITVALAELRAARDTGNTSSEWAWTSMLDRLIDRYATDAGCRPLTDLDPELSARLTVTPRPRLIGAGP